jgi:hypothetical protein
MRFDSTPSWSWLVAPMVLLALVTSACENPEGGARGGATSGGEANLSEILMIEEPLIRVERVAHYLQGAGYESLADVRHTFEHALLDRGDLEYALFIDWWSRFEPRKAYEYTIGGKLRGEHGRLRAVAARAWARQDPQGALESNYFRDARSLDGSYDSDMLDALVVGWWESGEPGLEEFLSGLTLPTDVTRGMRTYARRWIFRDGAKEALEGILREDRFPPGHHRLMVAGALTVIAHEDPELAIEWIPVAEENGIDTRTFQMRIAGGWGHHDPPAAMAWVLSLAGGNDRGMAVRRIADEWQAKDPDAFFAWLEQQQGEADLDIDTVRYISLRTLVFSAPSAVDWSRATKLLNSIESENRREAAEIWLLQVWHYLAPEGLQAWVDENPEFFAADRLAKAESIRAQDKRRLDRLLAESAHAESVAPLR